MSYGMTVRENFSADWAFGIISGMENAVRKAFPLEVRRWPLLQTFNFEAYALVGYLVIVLRDKLSGIPSGPGVLQPFPHKDHPPLPVTSANVDQWISYLLSKFGLRDEDAAMILPIHDSGRSDPRADFAMFSQEERQLWYRQLRYALNRHAAALRIPAYTPPPSPQSITYNLIGPNARVNVNSIDSSTNVPPEVLDKFRREILAKIEKLIELQPNARKASFTRVRRLWRAYALLMSSWADHKEIFGQYLPALGKLLRRLLAKFIDWIW